MLIYNQLSRSVNYLSQSCQQSSIQPIRSDTRSWYHGAVASMECLQAPLRTPSSPDRHRLVPLALNYTRLPRPKPKREPVRRLSKKYHVNLGFMSLSTYYLEDDRHLARLHRHRRRRRAYASTSNTASHDNHEKITSWVTFSVLYGYGAPLGGPSGRRSSATTTRKIRFGTAVRSPSWIFEKRRATTLWLK